MRLRNSLVIAVSLMLFTVDVSGESPLNGCCSVVFAQTLPQAPVIGGGSFLNCVERRSYVTPEERISVCLSVLQEGPESVPAMFRHVYKRSAIFRAVGEAHYEMGDYLRAIESYEAAITAAPFDSEYPDNDLYAARFGLAWSANRRSLVDLEEGNVESALHYAELAVQLGRGFRPQDNEDAVEFLETAGSIYVIEGMEDQAFETYLGVMQMGSEAVIQGYQEQLWEHGFYEGAFDGVDSGTLRSALRECIAARCPLNQ